MYTTKPIKAGDELALPDLMVTVEDNHDNMLRLSQLSQKTYTPWLMSQHTMNGQWALAQSEANHVAGIVPGIKMSARTNVNFNVDAKPPAQDTTLHRSVDAGAGASTTYHGSRMVAIVDIDQGQEIFVKPNSNDRNPSRQEESTPSRSVEWLTRHGQCIDNLSPGDSTVLQAGKGAFASRLIPRNTVVAPVPVVPLGRHHVDIVDRLPSDTTGAESASSQLLGKQLLLNYCYGHKNSSLLFFPSSPVVNYINHHNEPNVKLQWSTLWPPSTQVQSSSPESVAGNAEASLVMELVALRDILPGEEIFMDYGDGWSRQWREHESLTSSRLHHHDAGYVPAFRLNSRQEWLRTEHELETEPYPENVWVGCFVGNIRKIERMVAGRSGSLVEYWWEEEEGLYEDTKNLFPCDVLERISAQNVGRLRPEGLNPVPRSDPADFVEPRDRRESVAPLPVYYKVRAHNVEQARPNQQINFYPIPRNAIRFFDKPYTTDHSLRTAFRHEIQLPDDMMPPTWLDLTDGNDDDQSDPAMSSFASDEL
jgi:SET domain